MVLCTSLRKSPWRFIGSRAPVVTEPRLVSPVPSQLLSQLRR